MATYLLLRNNKQQGPLSLQHLIQLGLKPYDLVWVDGKSAAWRYPSEIPELKPYSDAVEEQPYDRFYKKPEERVEPAPQAPAPVVNVEPKRQEAVVKHMIREQRPVAASMPDIVFPDENPGYADEIRKTAQSTPSYQQKPVPESDIQFPNEEPMTEMERSHEKYYPKKTVYVTLPLPQTPEQSYAPKQDPVFNFQSSHVPDTREEPLTLKTKYEQPLDELKEQYANKYLERKRQSSKKKLVTESLKKAAVIILIISVGVLIGFAIKPGGNNNEPIANNHNNNPIQSIAAISLPEANSNEIAQQQTQPIEPPDETSAKKVIRQEPVYQQPEESKPVYKTYEEPLVENKKAVMTKQQPVIQDKEPDISEPAPSVDKNASTGERTKKTRQGGSTSSSDPATTYEKTESKNDDDNADRASLGNYVNVKSNNYHVVALGGIRNLQLTVSNDSKYVLDKVVVEVEYLKANQQLFKTEKISFKSVAPNGTLTIRMPDTNRGMKVEYKIIKVESKEYKEDVAGL
jgi:hypothetical protein